MAKPKEIQNWIPGSGGTRSRRRQGSWLGSAARDLFELRGGASQFGEALSALAGNQGVQSLPDQLGFLADTGQLARLLKVSRVRVNVVRISI